MPAGTEEPPPMLYMDREGSGHFALDPLDPTLDPNPTEAPVAIKSVLDLVVDAAPLQAEAAPDADADMAVAARDLFVPAAAAEARARRDRVREALLVRAKGEPKAGCSKLWTSKRRAAGAVFQPAAHGH